MAAEPGADPALKVGSRLRAAREAQGLSLRAFAERIGISASALSQIETDKSSPSVKALWAIVSELDLSLDELLGATEARGRTGPAPVVQAQSSRQALELDTGVTWERLTPSHHPGVDFVLAVYPPGSNSSLGGQAITHGGHEFGLVLDGVLHLTVDAETHELREGDSCSFDSRRPHRLANPGRTPTRAVWLVLGRADA